MKSSGTQKSMHLNVIKTKVTVKLRRLYIYILNLLYIHIYTDVYTLYNGSTQVKPECSISRAIYTMVWIR